MIKFKFFFRLLKYFYSENDLPGFQKNYQICWIFQEEKQFVSYETTPLHLSLLFSLFLLLCLLVKISK